MDDATRQRRRAARRRLILRSLLLLLLLAIATLPVWAADALLDRYLAEALIANPALAAEQQALHIAEARHDEARARLWPELAASARYTRADGGRSIDVPVGRLLNPVYDELNRTRAAQGLPAAFPSIDDQRYPLQRPREQDTRLSATLPLYAPQLHDQIEVQAALLDAARESREAAARRLVREVKRAYYEAIRLQAARDALDASLARLQENLRVSQALVDAGRATRERALRAEAERLALLQQLAAADAGLHAATRLLNFLRGAADDEPLALADAGTLLPPDPQAGSHAQSLAQSLAATRTARSPELRQLDAAIRASQAGVQAARHADAPSLTLTADYGLQGRDYRLGGDAEAGSVSLLLRWPLLDGGTRRAQRARAVAGVEQLRDQRRELEGRLGLARRAAEDRLAVALQALRSSPARLAAATETLRIAERKRAEALLGPLEFLDAERSLRDAQLARTDALCAALDEAAELERLAARDPLCKARFELRRAGC